MLCSISMVCSLMSFSKYRFFVYPFPLSEIVHNFPGTSSQRYTNQSQLFSSLDTLPSLQNPPHQSFPFSVFPEAVLLHEIPPTCARQPEAQSPPSSPSLDLPKFPLFHPKTGLALHHLSLALHPRHHKQPSTNLRPTCAVCQIYAISPASLLTRSRAVLKFSADVDACHVCCVAARIMPVHASPDRS